MTDEEPNHPTMLLQFPDKNGLPIPVEPGVIAGILLPILGQICEMNECDVQVTYGYQTNNEYTKFATIIESRGDAL